ncbi:MAG: RNA polymerase sigma factor RpoD/SigA [Candidatus Latescibacteria bacterium]|jgi:RNA polymerase primary sigma factor|nr:RNA polymerase sigma factor RpoD/SigA [Candidatus Latescibacterota bacterium]
MREVTDEGDSVVRSYFADIAGSRPLSREREVLLAASIKEGDIRARDELVQANLRFVVGVAKNYQNRGLSLSDLISAGNLGLLTAAERFDGTKGYKFISYAVWWIRQSILQTIGEHARTVRLPLNKLGLLKDISRVSQRLGQGREKDPDVEEIAAELEVSAAEVRDTLLSARATRSLDEAFGEDGENSLLATLADTNQEAPDAEVLRDSARQQLESLFTSLDDREQRIIRLYFGLDGSEPLTLEQIGSILNITRERVRQLKERALAKLRHPARSPALLALAGELPK